MSIPGQTMGVSVFTDHLMRVTAVSRTQLSSAYLVGTLMSGLLLPAAGSALDRYGTRATVVFASLMLACALWYMASIDHIAEAIAGALGTPTSSSISLAVLGFGFFSLRFSGQGLLTMVSRQLIGTWFDRLRGIVAGVSQPFVSFGFAAAPVGLALWIEQAGWRGAYLGMAIVVGGGMSLLGWLVYRDRPEDCGLQMDGDPADLPHSDDAVSVPSQEKEPEYTRPQALRTLAFWAVTFAMATQGLNITGITFHIVDLGAQEGLDSVSAVGIFPMMAIFSVTTSIVVGWLTNRVRLQFLVVFMMVFQVIGVVSIGSFGNPWMRGLAVMGMGVSGGCFPPLSTVAMPRFFGRGHLGAINSVMLMCIVWGSALGPMALALSRDLLGSYRPGLTVCATLPALAIVISLLARTPPRVPGEERA
ncbi:MAG: MFS transporter [bacterium]|nr:MFS transporter [bacterium]